MIEDKRMMNRNSQYPLLWYGGILGTLFSIFLLVILLVLVSIGMSKNTSQSKDINHISVAIDTANTDCEEKTKELNEQIDGLLHDMPYLECLEGLCSHNDFDLGEQSLKLQGCWNADTNNPNIVSGLGSVHEAFVVCQGGNTLIDGEDDWNVGDFIIYSSQLNQWIKNDGSPEGCPHCMLIVEQYPMEFEWNNPISPPFVIDITVILLDDDYIRVVIPPFSVNTTIPSVTPYATAASTSLNPLPLNRRPSSEVNRLIVTTGEVQGRVTGFVKVQTDGVIQICRNRECFFTASGTPRWISDINPTTPNVVGWNSLDLIYLKN